jgi:transcription antitermination factor NusG
MLEKEKLWYAVYTRPRFEKKISQVFARRNIEHFCPLNRVIKQWADRKKVVLEPLFSCYVFVRIDATETSAVRAVEGVNNFVHWMGKPAVIRNDEIDTVRRFLNDYENVRIEKIQVNLNDRIRIISGPLMMEEGNVVEVRSNTIKVCLPSLGYAMLAEVRLTNVEIIQTGSAIKQNQANANN